MDEQVRWGEWLELGGVMLPEPMARVGGLSLDPWLLLILIPFGWMSIRLIASEWKE